VLNALSILNTLAVYIFQIYNILYDKIALFTSDTCTRFNATIWFVAGWLPVEMDIMLYDPYFAVWPGLSHLASPDNEQLPSSISCKAALSLSTVHASWMTGNSTLVCNLLNVVFEINCRLSALANACIRANVAPV